MASNIPLDAYLDQSEVTEINQRFTSTAFIPDHQVLWTGILREEAQQWADSRAMQTLTTAMGPLMSPSHETPASGKKKSPKAHSRYIHGASILFAQRIAAAGTQVVVLCPPPPDRVNPSGGTGFQTLEEPIIKDAVCRSGNGAFSIRMCHPMVSGAGDFCYEIWPQDHTHQWVERFGQVPYKARKWRLVSNALRPIVNPGSLRLPQKVLIKSEEVKNLKSSSKSQEQSPVISTVETSQPPDSEHPVISNVETSQPLDSEHHSRWHCATYVLSLSAAGPKGLTSALWQLLCNLASSVKSACNKVFRAIVTNLRRWSSRVAFSRVLTEETPDTTRSAGTADHGIGKSTESESPTVVNLPSSTSRKAALASSISEPTTQPRKISKTSKPAATDLTLDFLNTYPKMSGLKASTAVVWSVESRVGDKDTTTAVKEKEMHKPTGATKSTKSEKKKQKAKEKKDQEEKAKQEKKRVKEMNRVKAENAREEKRQRIEKARAQERDAEARKKRKKEQAMLQEQRLKAQRLREQEEAREREQRKAQRKKEQEERAKEEKRQKKEKARLQELKLAEENRKKAQEIREQNRLQMEQAKEGKRRKKEHNKALAAQAREAKKQKKAQNKQANSQKKQNQGICKRDSSKLFDLEYTYLARCLA